MKQYVYGEPLAENEYLLKIRDNGKGYAKTGFLAKLTQKGKMPAAFEGWGRKYPSYDDLPIFVFEEKFRSGWKLNGWRFGQSQNWASLLTPEEFTVEVYMDHFLEFVQENTLVNGEIMANVMWKQHKLVKQ